MKKPLKAFLRLICVFLFAGFLNGCSGSADAPAPKVHTIEIRTMKFQPSELTVKKGDTVIFINRDFVVHDVTEAKTKRWNSMPLDTEKSYSLVVTRSEGYYCSLHPVMKGNITME